ncbi:MAG: N-acetylmuramoyl-L-alanine amidase [Prevotella sp.]|nr:N-acetylmuramoyl-L-alanine amidase [Prevotella sp.]
MLRKLIISIVCILGLAGTVSAADHQFTLVIDAGHGGKDGGACANGAKEKNINLSVALAFGKYVERNCPDVKVIYTRKTDVFIPLHKRADIANKNKADVFISIHTNAVASKRAVYGMETYTMGMRRSDEKLSAAMRENEVVLIESDFKQHYAGFDPRLPESYIIFDIVNETNMAQSVELAQLIQRHVCATAGRPNKGVKQDAFLVLRETSMPACLIELGYITTASEAKYLTDPTNVDAMGRGIYQAFLAYKNNHTQGMTTPPAQTDTQQDEQRETLPETPAQETPSQATEPVETTQPGQTTDDAPIFKVQILASPTRLSTNSRQLKGLTGVEYYKEGQLYKYTVGASANYNEISRLRREVLDKFPQAFIIAFKNGQRVDAAAALREFRNRNK